MTGIPVLTLGLSLIRFPCIYMDQLHMAVPASLLVLLLSQQNQVLLQGMGRGMWPVLGKTDLSFVVLGGADSKLSVGMCP